MTAFADWFTRVRRLPGVARLALVPLTLTETTQQLALLRGRDPEPDDVARIHARSLGQPLFTEQLALHPDDVPLPDLFADLLLRRLRGLRPEGWSVGRALGVADRPLLAGELAEITALDPVAGLRELDAAAAARPGRRPADPAPAPARGRRDPRTWCRASPRKSIGTWPRCWPPRRIRRPRRSPSTTPRQVTTTGSSPGASPRPELLGPLRRRRSSVRSGDASSTSGRTGRRGRRPPARSRRMHVAALDAVKRLDFAAAVPLMSKALEVAKEAAPAHAAAILMRASYIRGRLGDADAALELDEQAVAMYAACRHVVSSRGAARACWLPRGVGRFRESADCVSGQ